MSEKENQTRRTNASAEALKTPRVRWIAGRSLTQVEIESKKYKKAVDLIVEEETERCMIIGAIKEKGPLTVEEISQLTNLEKEKIMQHIIALRKKGSISEAGERNNHYIYQLS
ncbi:MAG: Hydrogenase iron-sulfur subunit [Thermoproteota archaeon]|nr:Hydrogenase iron-sulfur subunit [Thermoproteota archaeon]